MRYLVRAVAWMPERMENIEIMRQSIPQLELVTDRIGDSYGSFFDACHLMHDTGGVMLEDDVILCKNFTQRVENIITEKGPEHIISFFERPKINLDTKFVGGSQFLWMQCVYFPPGFLLKCVNHYPEFKIKRPTWHRGRASVDRLVSSTLIHERMKYWRIRPCLVQHQAWESAAGPRPKNRQTLFFIDNL